MRDSFLLTASLAIIFLRSGSREACSLDAKIHYPFDYAQQVHIPSNPFQPGPIYFKTPRECGIFGVICEGLPRQVNFVTDKASSTSKGANPTIGYVHHYFKKHGLGETDGHLNADNCARKINNNYFVVLDIWRTMMNLHHTITYSFLVAGHTQFALDHCFGLIKKAYKVNYVFCAVRICAPGRDFQLGNKQSTTRGNARWESDCSGRWLDFIPWTIILEASKYFQVSSFSLFKGKPWDGLLQRICVKPQTIIHVVKDKCHSSISFISAKRNKSWWTDRRMQQLSSPRRETRNWRPRSSSAMNFWWHWQGSFFMYVANDAKDSVTFATCKQVPCIYTSMHTQCLHMDFSSLYLLIWDTH